MGAVLALCSVGQVLLNRNYSCICPNYNFALHDYSWHAVVGAQHVPSAARHVHHAKTQLLPD